jgi:hypothetical protein
LDRVIISQVSLREIPREYIAILVPLGGAKAKRLS